MIVVCVQEIFMFTMCWLETILSLPFHWESRTMFATATIVIMAAAKKAHRKVFPFVPLITRTILHKITPYCWNRGQFPTRRNLLSRRTDTLFPKKFVLKLHLISFQWDWDQATAMNSPQNSKIIILQVLCKFYKNKANLRDLKAATGLVISLKLDSNHRFFARVTLKFDGWPRKIIRHIFYRTSSFVYHFISISEFKLELQSGNAQFGSNSTIFRAVWPWNLTDDLEK